MEKKYCISHQRLAILFLLMFSFLAFPAYTQDEATEYTEYSGIVVDVESGKALIFASLTIVDTNISTITNTDGEFLLKVPATVIEGKVLVSFLGYQKKVIAVSDLKSEKNRIEITPAITELAEINVNLPTKAKELVRKTLSLRAYNNLNEPALMTAFYRETIKKRKKNVSIAEAIVNVYKQPYVNLKKDRIKLFKARKSTDYKKLDTIALKLQGGPFNALYIDIMKYPEYIFTEDMIDLYTFNFEPSTTINEKSVYVIQFKQRNDVEEPMYYGKLFIDAQTLALTSATYSLNLENKDLVSNLFVRKKPRDVKVSPTKANYRVDYREKDGKWHYGYSNVELAFKVNRKGKLFNSTYSLTSEMAVTDWKINILNETLKGKDMIRPSIVISDEASGFSDPEFWGAYNVIEPEKSIESAINKIKKQLLKASKS